MQNKKHEKNKLKQRKKYLKGCAKEYGRVKEVAKEHDNDKGVEYEEQDANEHDLKRDTKESDRETEVAKERDKNERGGREAGREGAHEEGRPGERSQKGHEWNGIEEKQDLKVNLKDFEREMKVAEEYERNMAHGEQVFMMKGPGSEENERGHKDRKNNKRVQKNTKDGKKESGYGRGENEQRGERRRGEIDGHAERGLEALEILLVMPVHHDVDQADYALAHGRLEEQVREDDRDLGHRTEGG